MPLGTTVNIELGFHGITVDSVLAGESKFINLIAGDNIEIEAEYNAGTQSIDVTITATGGGTSEPTRLILTDPVDFSDTPLDDGESVTVATTMAVGKQLKDFYLKCTDIVTTPIEVDVPVQISVGIATDSPAFLTTDPTYGDSTAGFISQISVTNPTTAVNRNLVITAIGGSITGGTIDLIVAEYLM